jgi:hypothetical protein
MSICEACSKVLANASAFSLGVVKILPVVF